MARNAPISVKDLTAALAIGKEQGKQESQVAEKRPDSPVKKPGGKPWPGYPNPMPPGKDWPVELASLRINPNTILLPKEPAPAETDEDYGEGEVGDGWKLSHGGPFYNEYGQTIKDPSQGWSNNGVPLPQIDHLKQTPEEMQQNEQMHEQNYPDPSHELKISQTRKDKAIRNIMNKYGKDDKGNYKDPTKLLQNLLTIAQA